MIPVEESADSVKGHRMKRLCEVSLALASASPRRTQILSRIGIPHSVMPGNIRESLAQGLTPEETVKELARRKVESVRSSVVQELVLGADTIVVAGGEILGKPVDVQDALRMLNILNGKRHRVLTALCLSDRSGDGQRVGVETTTVTFRKLTGREILWYLDTGESLDKAGAYGIQGHGALLIESIDGCYYNVVGLPVGMFMDMLKSFRDDF